MKTPRFCACCALMMAFVPIPDLCAEGDVLLEDDFERAELGKGWYVNSGEWIIRDGVLRAREISAENHAAAARRALAHTDGIYELRFRFVGGGRGFHLGFDPAPGELDKKGHLFSVKITRQGWNLTKHLDKNRPQEDPNETLASASRKFELDRWYTLRLVSRGNEVMATIDGEDQLEASHPTFHVKKPTLVFRCVDDGVEIDDLVVSTVPKP
ncbi:MAG: hypothetical protein ACC661_11040 [Verrucomicrobiales bacterium]